MIGDIEEKAQALLKAALAQHNACQYGDAAGLYQVILARYPASTAAQFAQTNFDSMLKKHPEIEIIHPDETIVFQIETNNLKSQGVARNSHPSKKERAHIQFPHISWKPTFPRVHWKPTKKATIVVLFSILIFGIGGALYTWEYIVGVPEPLRGILSHSEITDISSIVKSRVNESLKDPLSAIFRKTTILFTKDDKIAKIITCGEVNAKNSYGGYAGYSKFVYVLEHGKLTGAIVPDNLDKTEDYLEIEYYFLAEKCMREGTLIP